MAIPRRLFVWPTMNRRRYNGLSISVLTRSLFQWSTHLSRPSVSSTLLATPPAGVRGIGPGRATKYSLSLAEHIEADDNAFATHVQLESEQAIENAAEIAAVDGIDGVFVGPLDLSMSIGQFGEYESTKFQDAVDRALMAAREADVAIGTFATNAAEREQRLAWDIDYLVAGVDLLYVAKGASEALAHSREFVENQ